MWWFANRRRNKLREEMKQWARNFTSVDYQALLSRYIHRESKAVLDEIIMELVDLGEWRREGKNFFPI